MSETPNSGKRQEVPKPAASYFEGARKAVTSRVDRFLTSPRVPERVRGFFAGRSVNHLGKKMKRTEGALARVRSARDGYKDIPGSEQNLLNLQKREERLSARLQVDSGRREQHAALALKSPSILRSFAAKKYTEGRGKVERAQKAYERISGKFNNYKTRIDRLKEVAPKESDPTKRNSLLKMVATTERKMAILQGAVGKAERKAARVRGVANQISGRFKGVRERVDSLESIAKDGRHGVDQIFEASLDGVAAESDRVQAEGLSGESSAATSKAAPRSERGSNVIPFPAKGERSPGVEKISNALQRLVESAEKEFNPQELRTRIRKEGGTETLASKYDVRAVLDAWNESRKDTNTTLTTEAKDIVVNNLPKGKSGLVAVAEQVAKSGDISTEAVYAGFAHIAKEIVAMSAPKETVKTAV